MRHLRIRTSSILRCTLIASLLLTGCDDSNKSVENQNAEFRKKQCADSALLYERLIESRDYSGAELAMAVCSTHFPSEYGKMYKTARTERLVKDIENESLSPQERLNAYSQLTKYAPERAGQLSSMSKEIEASKKRYAQKKEAERKRRARSTGVSIGMSKAQVLESSWGKPRDINRTINTNGTHEQWVYDGGYLYFDGDVLSTIQN